MPMTMCTVQAQHLKKAPEVYRVPNLNELVQLRDALSLTNTSLAGQDKK